MKACAAWSVVIALALAGWVRAADPPATLQMVPAYISYQGRLVDPGGTPYSNAMHSIELRLYDNASGGTVLWGEAYTVRVQNGFFALLLGSGGTPIDGIESKDLWRVLWSGGAADDQFFMGLTVLTDVNGDPLSTPVEATPRQQFVTSPFAFRAHQSRYAGGATDEFLAQQGINTPSITSTQDVLVTQSMRITGAGHELRTPRIAASEGSDLDMLGASGKSVDISVDAGTARLGIAYPDGEPITYAQQVQVGHNSGDGSRTYINGAPITIRGQDGDEIGINARNGTCYIGYTPGGGMMLASGPSTMTIGHTTTDINLQSDNFKFNSWPLFDFQKVLVSVSNGSGNAAVSGINNTLYDLVVVGFSASYNVRSVYISSNGNVYVNFGPDHNGNYPSGTAYVRVMGVRKGLMSDFSY